MPPTGEEKPYRLYRGGRVKGKVPTLPKPTPPLKQDGGGERISYPGPGAKPKRRRWTWRRRIAIGFLALFLLLVIWLLAGYLALRGGVKSANKRLSPAAQATLASDQGLLLSHSTTILLLGTDHSPGRVRASDYHSDSIMLLRTDPDHHRLAYLSIPRDLRIDIPGHGPDKVNTAYQIGRAALASRTVQNYTGIPVNHLVVIDFAHFKELIDALGGIDVDVPRPILSNPFDCPYPPQRCPRWRGWRFARGKQHLDGRRAMIYSRIRKNQLNPAESDITRAARQQEVLQATTGKLTSFGTFLELPFIGGDVVKPLATDLSTWQFVQLGWVKFRAGRTLHCRLGGDSSGGYITPSEDNARVILMFKGQSAPQPPPPSNETYPPGCLVGRTLAAAG